MSSHGGALWTRIPRRRPIMHALLICGSRPCARSRPGAARVARTCAWVMATASASAASACSLVFRLSMIPTMCWTCCLVGATAADHGQLDFVGRVFADRQVAHHHRRDRRAAGLAQLERRIGVARHEHLFDRDFVGRGTARSARHRPSQQQLRRCGKSSRPAAPAALMHVHDLAGGVDIDDAHAGALRAGSMPRMRVMRHARGRSDPGVRRRWQGTSSRCMVRSPPPAPERAVRRRRPSSRSALR